MYVWMEDVRVRPCYNDNNHLEILDIWASV
jgi:hypothetical protein